MNIEPKYYPGIELAPGTYDILVEKPGYIPYRRQVTLQEQDITIPVILIRSYQ
jgi:serine/threonine-protein kinase PpkA